MIPAFPKIQASTAAEVCAHVHLMSDARKLLGDGMGPREFLNVLIENKRYLDGIDFLAQALPPREGIWWGCLCMQHALGDALSPPDRAAAVAAVRWVMEPSPENRTAAKAPAGACDPMSPAGALAGAAAGAGAKSVARAVKIASLKSENAAQAQRSYLELGVEIAEGKFL